MLIVLTPAHFAAVIFDPKISHEILTEEEINSAYKFLEDSFNDLLPLAVRIVGGLAPFNKTSSMMNSPAIIKNMSSNEWWQTFQKTNSALISNPNLTAIQGMLTAVASSAAVERVFSKFGLIQSKVRNALGNTKAAKLVFIHHSLRSD